LRSSSDHVPIRHDPRVNWMEFSEATAEECLWGKSA
jgi:hypothetical protein